MFRPIAPALMPLWLGAVAARKPERLKQIIAKDLAFLRTSSASVKSQIGEGQYFKAYRR